MSAAMACLAVALLVIPQPTSRRRCARLFIAQGERPKPQRGTVLRAGAVVVVAALMAGGPGPFLAAAMVLGTMATRFRRARQHRRRNLECGYLLDALEAVIGELRVGAHPSAAAEVAAREARGDSARIFAVGAARSRLGGSAAEGLCQPDSIVAAELSRIADAWRVAEQHGLALAELLAATRSDLAGRIRFRGRTTAAMAGPRATATVLAGLPCLGIALGQMMGASPMRVLFASSAGGVLLPLGAGLCCAGLLWTDVITRKVMT